MSPEPAAPAELSFGAAYDRLQAVAAELGADATMAPDRLIALLREGKGLERALRDHLERVEQDVRASEDGDGAVPFRIVDAPRPAGRPSTGAPATGPGGDATGPGVAPTSAGAPDAPSRPASAPRSPAPDPEPAAAPPAPPTLGFPGADDDIPF